MKSLFLLLAILLATPHFSHALSCSCGVVPCEKPGCCESGSFAGDVCGCCTECAKSEGEACGGPWGISGTCAEGLSCYRSCGCQTINRKKCVFPFKYEGQVYEECTIANSENEQPWCATAVNPETGETLSGFWEDCASGCPGSPYACNLFNIDGQCVNATFRENVMANMDAHLDPVSMRPNFEFRNGVSDFKNDGSIRAPKCSTMKPSIEGNENTSEFMEGAVGECFCTTEENAKGEGPCKDLFNGYQDSGWCFLKSVADPLNPSKNCYPDAAWSATNGRFWSRDACKESEEEEDYPKQAPPEPFYGDDGDFKVTDLDDIEITDLDDDMPVSIKPIPVTKPMIHLAEESMEEKKTPEIVFGEEEY